MCYIINVKGTLFSKGSEDKTIQIFHRTNLLLSAGGMTLNSVECYDPVQNKWTNVTPMRVHRSGVGVLAGSLPWLPLQ